MGTWKRPTSWDEVCRRASGRRRYNRLRWYQRESRRLRLAEMLAARGLTLWGDTWPRGTQATIAAELNVSPATISRDVEALKHMQSRRRTSDVESTELASLRASIKQRLAAIAQLEQQGVAKNGPQKRAT